MHMTNKSEWVPDLQGTAVCVQSSATARNADLAADLWRRSEEWAQISYLDRRRRGARPPAQRPGTGPAGPCPVGRHFVGQESLTTGASSVTVLTSPLAAVEVHTVLAVNEPAARSSAVTTWFALWQV